MTTSKPRNSTPVARLQRRIPPEFIPLVWPLLHIARNLGVGVSGTRGIGKSQLLKIIAWMDFTYHQTPSIIIDPIGATIDGILSQICYFHPDDQAKLWRRIRYVNLSPGEHAVPLPLYYRTGVGRETSFTIAQRLPDALGKFDPKLREASVQGFNSLWELATHLGAVLVALKCQPSEIEPWLRNPLAWSGRLHEAAARVPEIRGSVEYLERQFLTLTPAGQRERSRALLNKLTLLADPATKAQFCSDGTAIDWPGVMKHKELVLFDLRHETDWEARRFKLLWLFNMITDFARRWGVARSGDRTQPLALMIDEVSFMFSRAAGNRSPLIDDLDALINQQSRNYNLWLTIAFQELYQLPLGLKQTLLSLGTQFWGRMTDPESMRDIADRVTVYDPFLQKKVENVYASSEGEPFIVDHRSHEYSFSEQKELNRLRFARLPKYTYIVSRTSQEGDPPVAPAQFSIARLAARQFPPPQMLADVRAALSRRDGQPIADSLAAISARGAISPMLPTLIDDIPRAPLTHIGQSGVVAPVGVDTPIRDDPALTESTPLLPSASVLPLRRKARVIAPPNPPVPVAVGE